MEIAYQIVTKIKENVEVLLTSIKEYEEDAEAKRLGIDTFSKNIEEHKKNIEKLENRAKAIIEKESTINELIQSAEEALNLKSAEGISAAFATQYNTANSRFVLGGWIFGAAVCILGAILITIWIASGKIDVDSHGISV
jgi:predicted  nucleic acid-binding Zn-ribbon protein